MTQKQFSGSTAAVLLGFSEVIFAYQNRYPNMEENSREVVEDRTDEAREPRGEKRSCNSTSNEETTEVKKVHWSTKPYTVISVDCPISRCDEQLPTEARLLMHLEKKHKVFENRCVAPRCAYSVRRLAKLHKHIKTIHKSIQSWKCLFCSEECDSWNELKYHNYENHERGSFKCRIEKCSFTHINRQPVVEHFNETHGSGIKKAQNAEKTAEPEQDSPGEQSPDEALNDEQSKSNMTKSSKNSLSKSTISASKTVSGFSKKSAKHSEQPSASASVIGASAQHSAKSTKSVKATGKTIASGSSSNNSFEASNVKGRPKLCKEMAKVIGTRGATELQSAKELKTRHYELKEAVPDQDGLKRATGPKGKKMICKMIELKYCTPRYKVTMECYSLKIMRFIGRRPLLSSFPQVYDIFLAEKVYYIFMSDCGCKSLYDVVLSGEHLSPGRIRGWIRSLIEAVCEMQKYGIAHRFIKLKHILIEQNSSSSDNHSPHSLKIVGWSKSVLFYDAKRKKALYQHRERRARKNNFLPPEAFHRLYDPSKADVWAVGVILISLTTGRYPFHVRAHLKFSAQWRRFVRQHPLNPIVRSLANRIFVIDSKRRIHAREALKHSYFSVEERQLVNRSVRGKPLKEQQQQHSAVPPSASAASKSPKTHSALVKSKSSSFASHAKSAVAKSRTYSSSPVRPSSAVKSAKSSSVPAGSLSGPKSDHTAASSSPSKSLSKSGYSSGSTLTNDKNGSRTSKLSKASIGASMKGSTSKSSKSSTSSKKATSKIKSKSGKRKSAKHKKSEKKKPKSSKPSKPKSKPVAEKSAKSVKATSKSEKDKHSKSKSSTSKSKKSKSTTASKPTSAKPKSLVVKSSKAAKSEISSKSTKEKVKSATADSDSKKAKTEKTSASDASAKGDDKEEKVAEGKDNHSNLDGGVSKQEMEAEADDAQAESDQAKEEEAEPEMDEVAKEEMEKEEGKDGEGKVAPDGSVDVEGVADEQEMQAPEEAKEQGTPEEMEALEGQGEDVNAGAAEELAAETAAAEGDAEATGAETNDGKAANDPPA